MKGLILEHPSPVLILELTSGRVTFTTVLSLDFLLHRQNSSLGHTSKGKQSLTFVGSLAAGLVRRRSMLTTSLLIVSTLWIFCPVLLQKPFHICIWLQCSRGWNSSKITIGRFICLWTSFVLNPAGCLATLLTRSTWSRSQFSRRLPDHATCNIHMCIYQHLRTARMWHKVNF